MKLFITNGPDSSLNVSIKFKLEQMGSCIAYCVFKNGKETTSSEHKNLWEISVKDIHGNVSELREKVIDKSCILVVNVASK